MQTSLVLDAAAKLNLDGIIETFTTWDYPQEIRKRLFTIYGTLTQYVLNDSDACGANKELAESMYFLRTLIENCDEMENVKNKQISLVEI